jgi:hydroxyacylglutathione hydrolase
MILKNLETGPLMVNCYIVGDETTGEAMVVDPGGDAEMIYKTLQDEKLRCTTIFNTHTHWDHIGGNAELKKLTGAPIVTHADEAPLLDKAALQGQMFGMTVPDSPGADRLVAEGDVIQVGSVKAKVIDLPGHSPAGLGLVFDKYVIVGDSLFAGSIGRTDFPGGNQELLLRMIREKVFTLPEETIVLPGHGPATTVEREKRFNPFF